MDLTARARLIGWVALTTFSSLSAAQAQSRPPLRFDPASYTTLTIAVDGAPMEVRRYHVVYVSKPVRMAAQQPRGMMGGPPPAGMRGRGRGAGGPDPNGAPPA